MVECDGVEDCRCGAWPSSYAGLQHACWLAHPCVFHRLALLRRKRATTVSRDFHFKSGETLPELRLHLHDAGQAGTGRDGARD